MAKNPLVGQPKSPLWSQTQKVDPSRIVSDTLRVLVDVERRMRPPLDCASALTTSSSTFTCGGRVSANTMQSAMSSGCIASTPS